MSSASKRDCCVGIQLFPDRVKIQQDSSAAGNPIENFSGTPFKSGIPANIIDVNGDETFRGRQVVANMTHVVEMRYFAGVTPKMRLLATSGIYKDRELNIIAVKIIRKPGTIPMQWIYCREQVAV